MASVVYSVCTSVHVYWLLIYRWWYDWRLIYLDAQTTWLMHSIWHLCLFCNCTCTGFRILFSEICICLRKTSFTLSVPQWLELKRWNVHTCTCKFTWVRPQETPYEGYIMLPMTHNILARLNMKWNEKTSGIFYDDKTNILTLTCGWLWARIQYHQHG